MEGAFPVLALGPRADALSGLVVAVVGVVASAPRGGADSGPAEGPVDAAGVARGLDEGFDQNWGAVCVFRAGPAQIMWYVARDNVR